MNRVGRRAHPASPLPLLALAALLAVPPSALAGAGRLQGEVRGADTRPVAGATVVALREAGEPVVAITASERDGVFLLDRLPTGRYRLIVTASGHAPVVLDDVDVESPFRAVVDVVLPAGEAPPPALDVRTLPGGEGPPRIDARLDDAAGAPLDKAWIRISPVGHRADPDQLWTGPDGQTAGGPFPPGGYRIVVGRAGYVTLDAGVVTWPGGTLTLLARLVPADDDTATPLEALLPQARFLPPPEPAGEAPDADRPPAGSSGADSAETPDSGIGDSGGDGGHGSSPPATP